MVGITLNKLIDPATIQNAALNIATGGLAAPLKSLSSEIFQSIVQRSGERLGLSPEATAKQVDTVAKSFGERSGNQTTLQQAVTRMSGALGMSGTQAANFERNTMKTLDKFINDQSLAMVKTFTDRANGRDQTAASGQAAAKGGTLGVLMAIAKAMGKAADQIVDNMRDLSEKLGDMGKIDNNKMSKYNEMSAELGAQGQMLKILTEALKNVIDSVGGSTVKLAGR